MGTEMRAGGMTAERLNAMLEEAVEGLTALDAERLEKIEESLSREVAAGSLFEMGRTDALRAVLARHKLLGTLLENTQMNLAVLERLRTRNDEGAERWAR